MNPNDPNDPFNQNWSKTPPQQNWQQNNPNQNWNQQSNQQQWNQNQWQGQQQNFTQQGSYIPPYNPYMHNTSIELPNAKAVQVCGIIGVILCLSIIGLILNIIALAMSASCIRVYNANPNRYMPDSLSKVKTGRTCAIVGLSILGFALLLIAIAVIADS